MTPVPDWLIERAALDEVAPAHRDRIARADPGELAARVAALRDDNAAELARHPAPAAVAQIEARVARELRLRAERRRRRLRWLGLATSAATALFVTHLVADRRATDEPRAGVTRDDGTRVKGALRLVAFRHVGEQIERLEQDTVVRAGDVIQLRYSAGGQGFGVIASIDGAGVVTLHYPLGDDAPPEATALAPDTTALPHAYALDDAPRFERFFFITANEPIDVQRTLAALRDFARRDDSATAWPELPAGLRPWSLRLRKLDRTPTHHESP